MLNVREKEILQQFKSHLVKECGESVLAIKLFGSKARGDYNIDSDIDILVVLKNPTEIQRSFIYGLVMELLDLYKIYLSVKIFSEKEFLYYQKIRTLFMRNLLKEGVNI